MDKGLFLKQIRKDKNYTLSYVASKVNITASLLSQIESGKITPSLKSLEDILKFYAINLSDFFKQIEQKTFILVRKNETETIIDGKSGCELTLLASKLQNNALESYLVKLHSNSIIDVVPLNKEINGERLIYIISGELKTDLNSSESFTLAQGDSLNFKSYIACRITNLIKNESTFLITGVPPIFA